MSVGLLTNAQAAFSMSADAVDGTTTTAIEALSLSLDPNGGRQVKGQLFINPGVAANGYTQGTARTVYDSFGAPTTVYESDGVTPVTVYTQGTLIGPINDVRIDFTATLLDQAFEDTDIYGGPRTQRSVRSESRF